MHTEQRPRRARVGGVAIIVVVTLVLGVLSFFLCVRHNDFPPEYHPDELSKAAQVQDGLREPNFNHPLLLLKTASLWARAAGASDTFSVVRSGRCTSALFVALGVMAATLTGWRFAGMWGACVAGVSLALCPPLVVHGHYFKEDAALVCGGLWVVLGAVLMCEARRLSSRLLACGLMALAIGLAASAKYVGGMYVVAGLAVIGFVSLGRWRVLPLHLVVLLVISGAVFVGSNCDAFESLLPPRPRAAVAEHVRDEVEHGMFGQVLVALPLPNAYTLRVASGDLMAHGWAFLLFAAVVLLRHPRLGRRGFVLAMCLITPVVTLAFCAIPFPRYALPVTANLYIGVALAICVAVGRMGVSSRTRHVVFGVVLLVIVGFQSFRVIDQTRQFADDSRQRARAWARENFPPSAVVVADGYAKLSGVGDVRRHPDDLALPLKVRSKMFVSELADSPAALADSGVDYVVVARPSYERFFVPGVRATPGNEDIVEHHRAFYATLFAEGKSVWSSVARHPVNAYTNPELHVFDIRHLRNAKQ